MRPLILSFTFIITLLPSILKAQDTASLTLDQALKYAERNQVKIKNAILDEQSSLARNREVTGAALPQLSAKGNVTHAPLVAAFVVPNFIKTTIAGDPVSGFPGLVNANALNQDVVAQMPDMMSLAFQPKWTTSATADFSQLLFEPAIFVALQARKTLEELAAKGVAISKQDVKVAVTKAYYNILIAEKRKGLIIQNIGRLEQMTFETNEIYKAGFAEKLDVDRLTVSLNNLKTERIRVDQMIGLAYMALKFQMGMPLETPLKLADSLEEQQVASKLLLEDLNFGRRYEFQSLQLQKDLYNYDVKRYKLGVLPTVSLFGNYGYTMFNTDKLFEKGSSWQKAATVGANVNLPLFDGFQRRSRLKQAQIKLQKTENDIENLKMALTLEEQNSKITLGNNLLALENQRKNMILAEDVYNTSRTKYKEGVGSNLEVMNAESALKEAQTNYFTALYDVMTARVDLQKALGLIQ